MSGVKQNPPDWGTVLAEIDPAEIIDGIRGLLALAGAMNALRDEKSPLSRGLQRLGLLADAAYLPDGGTANLAALSFMAACSEATTRRMVKRQGVARHEPTGRGSSMYRPGDIVRSSVSGELPFEDAARRTGVAPQKKRTPPTPRNGAGGE